MYFLNEKVFERLVFFEFSQKRLLELQLLISF